MKEKASESERERASAREKARETERDRERESACLREVHAGLRAREARAMCVCE